MATTRFVALLRGINVGKAKRVAMADLRAVLEGLGYTGVRTLLNSGNIVFDAPAAAGSGHAERIRSAVLKKLGVDSLVVVKTARDIDAVVEGNTLGRVATDPSRLLVAVTGDPGTLATLKPLAKSVAAPERMHVGKHAAYLWCPKEILKSKAGEALLKGLAESGTTRNWATIEKINAMMKAD